MRKDFLLRNTSSRTEILEQADRLVKCFGNEQTYNLAISILQALSRKDYCIWQTYSKYNIENNDGKKPTHERIQNLQARLDNVWHFIY